MLEIILKWTNAEIERCRTEDKMENVQGTFNLWTMNELKAYLGLLYFQGVHKNNHLNPSEMWSTEFGYNLYRYVMTEKKFLFIEARLRFDDKNTRAERRVDDILAPIRELWDLFIKNCKRN